MTTETNRQGEVWVFAEQEGGILNDVSLELCGKARQLGDELGVPVGAVLPGYEVDGLARRLIAHGVDRVYLTDNPRLTVKTEYVDDPRNPIRVVLDSRGRTPNEALVLNGETRTVIVTAEECDRTFPNAEVIRSGTGRVDLQKALRALEEMGVQSLLVEGGAEVIWSFLKSRLADEMCIFIGSLVIGGDSSPTPAGGEGASSLEDTVELRLINAEMLGDGILLEYEVAK